MTKEQKLSFVGLGVRYLLSIFLLIGAYGETGVYTTIILTLIFIGFEVLSYKELRGK